MMQRRCPILAPADEEALIDLAKAGKLDPDTLESFTPEEVRVLQSVEEIANSKLNFSFISIYYFIALITVFGRES